MGAVDFLPERLDIKRHLRGLQGDEGGGSQPQVFEDGEGRAWMVKAQNNPQGLRVLIAEYVAACLGRRLGAAVQPAAICDVPDEVAESVVFQDGRRWAPGPCFGSLLLDNSAPYLATMADRVTNHVELLRVVAVDTWLTLHDGRQARAVSDGDRFRVIAVDFGHCLGPGSWTEASLQAAPPLTQLHDPQAWIKQSKAGDSSQVADEIDGISNTECHSITGSVPPAWGLSTQESDALTRFLIARRPLLSSGLRKIEVQGG